MGYLIALSLTTAVLCGLWIEISAFLGLLAWAGFAGCTSFFAAGGKAKGFKSAVITNLSGVLWAVVTIHLSNLIGFTHAASISTALITFIMCAQSKNKLFEFIPGTFIGSFTTFAAGGDWKAVIPALLCGAVLGYACESSGIWLNKITNKRTTPPEVCVSENING